MSIIELSTAESIGWEESQIHGALQALAFIPISDHDEPREKEQGKPPHGTVGT